MHHANKIERIVALGTTLLDGNKKYMIEFTNKKVKGQ